MFALGHLIRAIAGVVSMLLWVMNWMILIRVLISWVNADPYNPIVQFLHRVTEPILAPFRRILPPGGMDFSPFLAVIAIYFLQQFLVPTLYDLARQFS